MERAIKDCALHLSPATDGPVRDSRYLLLHLGIVVVRIELLPAWVAEQTAIGVGARVRGDREAFRAPRAVLHLAGEGLPRRLENGLGKAVVVAIIAARVLLTPLECFGLLYLLDSALLF